MSAPLSSGLSHAVLLEQVGWIRRLARALVADRDLAGDLGQGTCVAALERPPSEPGRLRAWLAAVLRNALRQHARSSRRRALREAAWAQPEAVPRSEDLARRAAL